MSTTVETHPVMRGKMRELDLAIDQLENLAIGREPRSPFEDEMVNCVLVALKTIRHRMDALHTSPSASGLPGQ